MPWLASVLLAALAAAGVAGANANSPLQAPATVLVFAASSLQTVLDTMTPELQRGSNVTLQTSYAASSALARQIESGAPADLFISADLEWMDYLQSRKAITPETRVNLAGNRLVLIAPAASRTVLPIRPKFGLAAALGGGRLAVADPSAVPAGKYARAALDYLGVWSAVESRLAPAENVRAALLLVSRGETPLGIVYRTDALADRSVRIVDTFPAEMHAPVVYPAAVTVAAPQASAASRVLAWLQSDAARRVFDAQGFDVSVK
jgi:molybdate transport system substrate-binding protein